MEAWRQSQDLNDFSWVKTGKLVIYRDEKAFHKSSLNADPQFQKVLSSEESVALEPSLTAMQSALAGAIFSPSDETADCYKFCQALLSALKSSADFTLRTSTNVLAIPTKGQLIRELVTTSGVIKADDYIICAGNGAKSLLKPLGVHVPIYPLKGYSLTLPYPDEADCVPKLSTTDYNNKIVYAKLGDKLRIAAMVDIGYKEDNIRRSRIDAIKKLVNATFPKLQGLDQAAEWSGLRPSTPKGPPILGGSAYANLWLNVGHGSLGFTLAAGSAVVLAALIAKQSSPIDLSGLILR